MKLWLDDVRTPPPGWVHARSVDRAIAICQEQTITEFSLDHDLGAYSRQGGDGIALLDWCVAHDYWPTRGITVHSSNPVGVKRMLALIDRYSPYPPGHGISRGQRRSHS